MWGTDCAFVGCIEVSLTQETTMPYEDPTPFKVAVVQATPVFLDRAATVEKACELIACAGREGARLIVFPEAFIPTYPDWVWTIPPGEMRLLGELYAELVANAVTIPSDATERLCRAAKLAGAYVVMGINERNVEASGESLYNTLLYIDDQGQIMGKHRKLIPTAGERLVWAQGDGSTLHVYDTPLGKLGGLICWENYMPLARYTMYAWGTQIYVAPTWDRGNPWLSTLRHIAKEGGVYVLGCCMVMRKDDIPDRFGFKEQFYASADEWINVGDSAIVHPEGGFLAGPVRRKEEILYAEIDPRQWCGPRWMLDVAGHYARPDVFELIVHTDVRHMIKQGDVREESEPGEV
jgi:nitrilase